MAITREGLDLLLVDWEIRVHCYHSFTTTSQSNFLNNHEALDLLVTNELYVYVH